MITNLHVQTGRNFFAWTAFLTAFLSAADVDSRPDAFFFGFASVVPSKRKDENGKNQETTLYYTTCHKNIRKKDKVWIEIAKELGENACMCICI
jgi:hypothetical protein